MFVMLAVQPACVPVPVVMVPRVLPVVVQKAAVPAVGGLVHDVVVTYLSESEKYASSAVTRLRRSDFMDAAYAFCLVLANFGIAIAARMPMMTTTINSSISVKPLRFTFSSSQRGLTRHEAGLALRLIRCQDVAPQGVGLRTIGTTRYSAVWKARGGRSTATAALKLRRCGQGDVSGITPRQLLVTQRNSLCRTAMRREITQGGSLRNQREQRGAP